jgi:hypothetical protein
VERTEIHGLTLKGGQGVIISPRSRVTIARTRIVDSTFHGLTTFGASVDLTDVTIEGSAILGVQALSGSRVSFQRTVVKNNRFAMDIGLGSFASLDGDSVVASNGGSVTVNFGSMLQVGNAVIEDNSATGLQATGGSVIHFGLGGGIGIIRRNTGDGMSLTDTSVASALYMGGHAEIRDNGRFGVSCSASPGVAQLVGPIGVVEANTEGDINCPIGY